MDIQAIGASATVALLCAIVFVLALKSWYLLTRVLSGHPSFADSIMSEAAQRFRDELQSLSRRQATYVGAAVVFVVMYATAMLLEGPALFAGYPQWQLYAVFAALLAAAGFAAWRLLYALVAWRSVRFLHDANMAIGHQLQQIAAEHGRAYHDVPTPAGIIDHVLVGQNGIYAINVVARRRWRKGTVEVVDDHLSFSTTDRRIPLAEVAAGARRLARECRQLTGRPVRIRSVIAVPGWEIAEQSGHEHLLVNERNIAMLRGWRDRGDYLMDEETTAVQQELARRCSRTAARRQPVKTA